MTLEEIRSASKNDLRRMINNNFERSAVATDDERSALIAQAEFLMRELDRRNDSWVSIRDLILEIVVIVLIGWEIRMSYRAETLQKQNFNDEKKVFENLDKSSSATATTLTALSETTQTMNGAIQEQLGLYYDVILVSNVDSEHQSLNIMNNSKTTVYFCGIQGDGNPGIVYKKPSPMLPGELTQIGLLPFVQASHALGPSVVTPIDIFFKNQRGEQFVGRFRMLVNGTTVVGGPIKVTRETWSDKIKSMKDPSATNH